MGTFSCGAKQPPQVAQHGLTDIVKRLISALGYPPPTPQLPSLLCAPAAFVGAGNKPLESTYWLIEMMWRGEQPSASPDALNS